MRIRTAIFGVYVAACAIGFAVLMWFMLAEVRPRFAGSLQRSLDDTARLLAAALADRPAASLTPLAGVGGGVRVRVLDASGNVFLDTDPPDRAGEAAGFVRRAAGDILDGGFPVRDARLSASAPVRLAGGLSARVEVSRPLRSLNELVWAERVKLSLIALSIAAAMVVLGWWLAARLTHSLERLTVYAQGVRDGRPVVPPASRAREIAALAQAFEEMRDALEGRQHAARYTKALAHEVKAPLTAIRGAAELLAEDMPADRRRVFLANIRGEVARVQRIVERLLELTSVEARKALDASEIVGARELLAEAAEGLRSASAAARVALVLEAPDGLRLRAERFLLRQALANLLQNALDFSPAASAVTCTARAERGGVLFTVEDRGPGVPDYALPRVFERFYSLPRPGTAHKSTGIGLALVREIAHLHGGEARLANRPDGGACATLWLPAAE